VSKKRKLSGAEYLKRRQKRIAAAQCQKLDTFFSPTTSMEDDGTQSSPLVPLSDAAAPSHPDEHGAFPSSSTHEPVAPESPDNPVSQHDHTLPPAEADSADCDVDMDTSTGLDISDAEPEPHSSSSSDNDTQVPYPTDPALFQKTALSPVLVRCLIEIGPCQLGLKDDFTFPYDESHRRFSHNWYSKTVGNGSSKVERRWLIYLPRLHRLFCFACKNEQCSDTWMDPKCGFSNLKKGGEKIEKHENSKIHRSAETELFLTKHRLFQDKTCYRSPESTERTNSEKNRQILRRLIDTALFLAQQGLAFRGHREYSCGSQNEGNYLELLKLLAKYDALLAQHIKTSKHNETYLSQHIQNDCIHALATEVLSAIKHEVQEAKFFSVIVDSTIHIGHVDQFSLSLQYVNATGQAIEHFIIFHDLPGSSAEDFFHMLESSLELNINIVHCQGQAYAGASTMSGNISGLQNRVKEVSPTALFVHCYAQNLNLVLMDAASCCTNAQLFFGTIESLYTFLTSSLPCLRILKEEQEKLDTAVQVLKKLTLHNALDRIVSGGIPNCNPKVVSDAQGLLSTIETFEFKFMLIFWRNVLDKIYTVSTFLQSSIIDQMTALNFLDTCLSDVEALHSDKSFSFFEDIAQQLAKECDTTVTFQEKHVKKKKTFHDENLEDCPIKDARQKFKVETYFYVLDNDFRMVASKFNALNPKTFDDKHTEININAVKDLTLFYNNCINEEDLLEEYTSFQCVFKNILSTGTVLPMNEVLRFLLANDMKKVFPNIYMTLSVSSANAKRSFSRLKIIKKHEERLSDLALLSIERDLAGRLEYEKVIDTFAKLKPQRKKL
uniref:DUF4371 domain-containing protein n=1 Tax=Latimeria chalumnae TaxID=7897 RepID=H3A3B1_LATCH